MTAHFTVEMGRSWRQYAQILHQSVDLVNASFEGSELEERVKKHYKESLPKRLELPINWLLRNMENGERPVSELQRRKQQIVISAAHRAYYIGKIPFLRRVVRLESFSVELYIGRSNNSYVSKIELEHSDPLDSHLDIGASNLTPGEGVDFDVGFTGGGDYFFKINAAWNRYVPVGTRIYAGFKQILDDRELRFREEVASDDLKVKLF